MARVDMHVHSRYSGRPSDWFLKKFGTNESYTEPEEVYRSAKAQGMDFVTITDHNTIAAAKKLKAAHPEDVFIGCEFTTYFPEDGCKVHCLVYDITDDQYRDLNQLRNNIYDFREYIRTHDIAHSLAHATYSINNKLTLEHLEKFILMFNVFEGINGSRNKIGNDAWTTVLTGLTPEIMAELQIKHGIEPMGDTPWIKGLTGGSDDHGNMYIARTWTELEATSPADFVSCLKQRKSVAAGRHNDYRSFAFMLYKVLYDFSKKQSRKVPASMISQVSDLLFENKQLPLLTRIKASLLRGKVRKDKANIREYLVELIDGLQAGKFSNIEERIDFIFHHLADIFDGFMKIFAKSLNKSIKKGDYINIVKNVSSFLPSLFLTAPFFSTLSHMYAGRPLINRLRARFNAVEPGRKKRIMWFTDTINDLNGVSVTLKTIGRICHETGRELVLVSSLGDEQVAVDMPPNFINLPSLFDFKVPHYESLKLKIPSLLKSIEMLYRHEPDEVYISSPATLGMFGLLFAKLISARTVGVWHTDFTEQARRIVGHETVVDFIEMGTRVFFSQLDEIAVPTNEYIDLLEERGYDRSRMSVFKRGIQVNDSVTSEISMCDVVPVNDGFTLMYAGRVSQDKNLEFLFDVYDEVLKYFPDTNLVLAGDGPWLNEIIKKRLDKYERLYCTGYLEHNCLPVLYTSSDLFVFPSNTDTFGMVVLEAQAYGLPCIVTNMGGPQELVKDGITGYIRTTEETDSVNTWARLIRKIIRMKQEEPGTYNSMREVAKTVTRARHDWEAVLSDIFDEKAEYQEKESSKVVPA
jgi:glycosyltransferase involved in cell wall biosynthesis